MSSKEFNLMMSLILKLLEKGQIDDVIELIKKAMNDESNNGSSNRNKTDD